MEDSKKPISSSTKPTVEEKHEEAIPSPLPQHPVTSPVSFNFPSSLQTPTCPSPISHDEARYCINSDGYINNHSVGLRDGNHIFREKPVILEISSGLNIINYVAQFAQRNEVSVTVLSGNGLISNVDFMYLGSGIPPMHMYGRYQIISFSGNYNYSNAASYDNVIGCFTVSLIDGEGYVIGGLVASTLKAYTDVMLVALITNDLS